MIEAVVGEYVVDVCAFSEGDVYGPAPITALSRIPASAGLAMELEFGVEPLQDLDDAALEDVITS